MERGEIVECRDTRSLFEHPEHPYTRRLIAALPVAPRFEHLGVQELGLGAANGLARAAFCA